jgi:uroporphyrinogen-III synthase
VSATNDSPPPGNPAGKALAGKRIALPETRELDRLAGIFEEEGATTVRCPLVAILDAPDPSPVDEFLHKLAHGDFDDLIVLTGEGLNRLLARAGRIGLEAEVRAALARVRKVTRGPKPARALHEIGLKSDLPARSPTTGGIIETLAVEALRGRRVGVQLYGTEENLPLVSFLTQAGATVTTVAPYIYAPAADATQVIDLIRQLDAGQVDAIAFTSASQVDRIFEISEKHALEPELRRGLSRTLVAAIGPVAAEALRDRGCEPRVPPEKPFIMKRLVQAIVTALSAPGESDPA